MDSSTLTYANVSASLAELKSHLESHDEAIISKCEPLIIELHERGFPHTSVGLINLSDIMGLPSSFKLAQQIELESDDRQGFGVSFITEIPGFGQIWTNVTWEFKFDGAILHAECTDIGKTLTQRSGLPPEPFIKSMADYTIEAIVAGLKKLDPLKAIPAAPSPAPGYFSA